MVLRRPIGVGPDPSNPAVPTRLNTQPCNEFCCKAVSSHGPLASDHPDYAE